MLALATSNHAHEGDWLIAGTQTAGRGRAGRHWQSPVGNLHATGLIEYRPDDPPAPMLALVAGIAVVDALAMTGAMLKWPNDVLVDGAKLAGILLERQQAAIAVGVGVNLVHRPDDLDRSTTTAAAHGSALSPDDLLARLSSALINWVQVWRSQPALIRSAWLQRAHPLGTPLAAALPDGTRIAGQFAGLTEDGALRLTLPAGSTRVIHAADVFLGLE